MANSLRIATFNVENLFARARLFQYANHDIGDSVLAKVDDLRKVLVKQPYTPADKARITTLHNELKDYIEIREDRGKLFKRKGVYTIVGVQAGGADDWDGAIEFKTANFSNTARRATAQVIKDAKADIICLVEVEGLPSLRAFDSHLLNNRYEYEMLIDANDPRGIDVGLLSKFPIGRIASHMYDKKGNRIIFSRDCLELEVLLPSGRSLFFLLNHFKSRGYDKDGTADTKRRRQAERVVEILADYDLKNDCVVVAGDFNDSPESPALQPLLSVPDLHDVLALGFSAPSGGALSPSRWTYHYKKKFEQIDFLLVSRPLKTRFKKAAVVRQGIFGLNTLTASSGGKVPVETEYPELTRRRDAASDHGAVWAEFTLP